MEDLARRQQEQIEQLQAKLQMLEFVILPSLNFSNYTYCTTYKSISWHVRVHLYIWAQVWGGVVCARLARPHAGALARQHGPPAQTHTGGARRVLCCALPTGATIRLTCTHDRLTCSTGIACSCSRWSRRTRGSSSFWRSRRPAASIALILSWPQRWALRRLRNSPGLSCWTARSLCDKYCCWSVAYALLYSSL